MTDQGEDNAESGPSSATLDQHRQPNRVQSVYDEIASHFSKTRAYPWPEVEVFLDHVDSNEHELRRGLDIGCGNGRHTAPLSEIVAHATGLDLSRELLGEARDARGRNSTGGGTSKRPTGTVWQAALVHGAAESLPIQDDVMDIALYVATIHHLPDRETRIASLRELDRVLTSSGTALVSAWSTTHDRFSDHEGGFDTTIDWTLPGGETVPRFYHIYAPEEFERDLATAGMTVKQFEISSGNCYATVATGDSTHS